MLDAIDGLIVGFTAADIAGDIHGNGRTHKMSNGEKWAWGVVAAVAVGAVIYHVSHQKKKSHAQHEKDRRDAAIVTSVSGAPFP
jgi:hypothetical protein